MKILQAKTVLLVQELQCDRCGRRAQPSNEEFTEFLQLDRRAGYGSIFGDGQHIELALCQHCIHEVLGKWLRVQN